MLLSAGIAFVTIALGQLNVIAPVVSMFFLISYGLLNYATYFEARTASPSFRPRFRLYHRYLSLAGFLVCLGAMLAVDLGAGVAGIAVLAAIYQYLARTAGPARWADSRRSFHMMEVRRHLLAAAAEPEHARDWRPQVLALSDDPPRREQLLRFASWLAAGSGLITAVRLIISQGPPAPKLRHEAEDELRRDLQGRGLNAFPLAITASDPREALRILGQAYGIGPLRANLVLINWMETESGDALGLRQRTFSRNLRAAHRYGLNLVVLHAADGHWPDPEALQAGTRRIDVWWRDDATSRLSLLLAYLTTRHHHWDRAEIRVLTFGVDSGPAESPDELARTLDEARITARVETVPRLDAFKLTEYSKDAGLVFLPLRIAQDQLLGPFDTPLDDVLERLPLAALVLAAQDIVLDAEPEEGPAGDLARAGDYLAQAEKRAQDAQREADQAEAEKERLLAEAETALDAGDRDQGAELVKAYRAAKAQAEKAARRAVKARLKVDEAARSVSDAGGSLGQFCLLPAPQDKGDDKGDQP